MQKRDRADDQQRRHDHALDDRLVVPLADERPQALIEPERGEDDEHDGNDPPDRRVEQVVVARQDVAIEPQLEGEEVGERDQHAIHQQQGQRVPVDGEGRGSDPPAHAGHHCRR